MHLPAGAIKFVMSGANIMCRGLTSPGATIHEEVITAALQNQHALQQQVLLHPVDCKQSSASHQGAYSCTVHKPASNMLTANSSLTRWHHNTCRLRLACLSQSMLRARSTPWQWV